MIQDREFATHLRSMTHDASGRPIARLWPRSRRMIVLKFGGTSVGNAQRVREAAQIALDQPAPARSGGFGRFRV